MSQPHTRTMDNRTATQVLSDYYKSRARVRREYLGFCAEHNILIDVEAVIVESRNMQNKMIEKICFSVMK